MSADKDVCRAYKHSKPGPPSEVLKLDAHHAVPQPGPDEVLVEVSAVALNPVDWKLMTLVPRLLGKYPSLTACDYSGKVLESKSPIFKPGEEVFGMVGSKLKVTRGLGTLAEKIVVPAQTCAKRPDSVSSVEAAGVSLVGLTALEMTKAVDKVNLDPGHWARVLVCGGSTSVGLSLIPILKDKGCYVAATCSQPKADMIKARGADDTFDYKRRTVIDDVLRHCRESQRFDVVLDCADSFSVWQSAADILVENGIFMNVGADLSAGLTPLVRRLFSYYLHPAFLGGVPRRYSRPAGFGTRARIDELASIIQRGVIKPIVDSEFGFGDAIAAFDRLKSNRATGKIVIRVVEPTPAAS